MYREPLPVRPGAASLGALAGALWMLLFGAVATNVRGYAWASLVASVLAWGVAALLVRYGDRGTGVGVALSAGVGLSVAGIVVLNQLANGHWVLW
jgi:hypothetical protein